MLSFDHRIIGGTAISNEMPVHSTDWRSMPRSVMHATRKSTHDPFGLQAAWDRARPVENGDANLFRCS